MSLTNLLSCLLMATVFVFAYELIPAVYQLSEQSSNNNNNKTNRRSLRSSDTSIENSNKSDELVIENPERYASTSGDSTTNSNFAVLFANTASVESLTHWAKSDLLLPYIAELKTFWLGAVKRPFKLKLRALDPFQSDLKFDNDSAVDSADRFLDIFYSGKAM